MPDESLLDRYMRRAKDNPIVACLGLVVLAAITIAAFSDAVGRLSAILTGWRGSDLQAHIVVQTEPISLDPALPADSMAAMQMRLVAPILDIKVVNRTERTQYLDNLRISATRTSLLEPSGGCYGLFTMPSGFYDVGLSLRAARQAKEVSISHVLKPGEADRFLVSLAPEPLSGPGEAEFRLAVLIEGLGDLQVKLRPVRVKLTEEAGSCFGSPLLRSGSLFVGNH